MSVRRTIFDSHNERELFVAIDSYWSSRGFALYPSLPFSNVFDNRQFELSPEEKSFLLKTSSDYTLCTRDGKPLVSVEFDGLCHGFSRLGRYVAQRPAPSNDPRRYWKLDLRVRLATEANYPLLVVSYHEKNVVTEGLHLTIVDGIIGQVLAKQYFAAEINRRVEEAEPEFETLRESEIQERIEDLVLTLEVETDLKWNPLAKAAAEAEWALHEAGITSGHSSTFLDPPGIPGVPLRGSSGYAKALAARVEALNRAVWVGCRISYPTRRGDASADAWVRNIEHAGVSPLSLAEDIAKLLAAKRTEEMFADVPLRVQ